MLARVPWRAQSLKFLGRSIHGSRPVAKQPRAIDELFVDKANETLASFPLVTAADLARHDKLPTQVRMLARDFIDNSLYNPYYGYFSKRAVIFSAGDKGFDFANIKDALRFDGVVSKRYEQYGDDPETGPGRQIWHTPTELFKARVRVLRRSRLTLHAAVVRESDRRMSRDRLPRKVLPLRRLYSLRSWRRERYAGSQRARLSARTVSGRLRAHEIPHHRDQQQPRGKAAAGAATAFLRGGHQQERVRVDGTGVGAVLLRRARSDRQCCPKSIIEC